jgi:hypothetical protein
VTLSAEEGAMDDDIEAIKRVQGLYCRAADTKDWDLLRPTVTDGFSCDTGSQGRGATIGIDAFIERIEQMPAVTAHHAVLPEIELTSPTTASGVWAVHNFARMPDGTTVDGYGHYFNSYEKIDGSWRLSVLKLKWLHQEVRPGQTAADRSS